MEVLFELQPGSDFPISTASLGLFYSYGQQGTKGTEEDKTWVSGIFRLVRANCRSQDQGHSLKLLEMQTLDLLTAWAEAQESGFQ